MNKWKNTDDDGVNRAVHEQVMGLCPGIPLEHNGVGYGVCPKCGCTIHLSGHDVANYCQDLNAAARAEAKAIEAKPGTYGHYLVKSVGGEAAVGYFQGKVYEQQIEAFATATARTRCIAILTALEITEEQK